MIEGGRREGEREGERKGGRESGAYQDVLRWLQYRDENRVERRPESHCHLHPHPVP